MESGRREEDRVDELDGGHRSPAGGADGVEAAVLSVESDEALLSPGVAADAEESLGEETAFEAPAEGFRDEGGRGRCVVGDRLRAWRWEEG
jgi:hypothetical protein